MVNAKLELQSELDGKSTIKCAKIVMGDFWGEEEDDDRIKYKLTINHTAAELESFYKSLDFQYNNGYGGQELFGTIWLEDGTWLSRGEYDGSEWWEHNVLPQIPSDLL